MTQMLSSGRCGLNTLGFVSLMLTIGCAVEAAELPQPLTLDAALNYVNSEQHFQLLSAQYRLQQVEAEADNALAGNDLEVKLAGHLREVGVSDLVTDLGLPERDDDSKLSLFVRKPLYDFGKSATRDELGQLNADLARLQQVYLLEQRELSIVDKFFAVLNADNEFLRHNEDLAIGFIRWDRARENQELGLTSEIEVIEKQTAYEVIRQNRYQAENMQRLTRILLAEELGFPDSPPSEVAVPELRQNYRIGDDVDTLVAQAFQHSLQMQIQQKKLQISAKQLELAEHSIGPKLEAELEFSDYAREGRTRDDWRASIYFDVPLYSGSRKNSAIDIAQARHQQVLLEIQQLQSELRVEVLQLWQAIRQNALKVEGELINQEYRDMYLDRSRAEYELEFKTDLGDAMVQFSDSRMKAYRARFALELAWRKLEKLVGPETLRQMQATEVNNG